MYSEWSSVTNVLREKADTDESILRKFAPAASKQITCSVVKQLAVNLGITQASEPSFLTTDKEVLWCMEVIRYGLGLPLTEHDTVRDCVNIYCEWLSALYPVPKTSVPKAVYQDVNYYCRKIIIHFHNLFTCRKGEGLDIINKQAVLCHRVLRTLQHVSQFSSKMDRDTWHCLLFFLITVNDTLLTPPITKDDAGDQLCERVLNVLLEIWLVSCLRSFPTPPMWKTLYEASVKWRHHAALIDQWNRINLLLTYKLLEIMFGSPCSSSWVKMCNEDLQAIINGMTADCVVQTWFRILHIIGSPVHSCRQQSSATSRVPLSLQQFPVNVDKCYEHLCLPGIPPNFQKAVKGVAALIDAFLRYDYASCVTTTVKPKCNSILHLFGEWLFEAAFPTGSTAQSCSTFAKYPVAGAGAGAAASANPVAVDSMKQQQQQQPNSAGLPTEVQNSSVSSGGASSSFRKSSSQPSSFIEVENDRVTGFVIEKYMSGHAEAIGALCRILCSKTTGEEILPIYLSRFYIVLYEDLRIVNERDHCDDIGINILLHASSLLHCDLDGISLLIPSLIAALEFVLPEKKVDNVYVNDSDLRKAAIRLLLSLLALPLHFQNLLVKDIGAVSSSSKATTTTTTNNSGFTFGNLKLRLINLLINALEIESDCYNAHMLLSGLLFVVQDIALFEEQNPVKTQDTTWADYSSCWHIAATDLPSATSIGSTTSSDATFTEAASLCSDSNLVDSNATSLSDYSHTPVATAAFANKGSAHVLFVRATYLVCHRLVSNWKTDLTVSSAALQVLSGIAKIRAHERDVLECKHVVKWLCEYVVYQCSRPPPAHSKDLHSNIVAALQCTVAWLVSHSHLLLERDSLYTLLEIVELGISGTKSQGRMNDPVKLKDRKELKPVSMRVRDAAEALLTVILEQLDEFLIPRTSSLISHIVKESSLQSIGYENSGTKNEQFQHFVLENNILISILRESFKNKQDSHPAVTLIIRNGSGRHVWTLQLRQFTRHNSASRQYRCNVNPGRPVSMVDIQTVPHINQKYFPIDTLVPTSCKVDTAIPSIESLLEDVPDSDNLKRLIRQHSEYETNNKARNCNSGNNYYSFAECNALPSCPEFRAGKLFLSHIGLLFGLFNHHHDTQLSSLSVLDSGQEGFYNDLNYLDSIPAKIFDTCHIFYVRAGQSHYDDILNNVLSESSVCHQFLETLHSQGWPVRIDKHTGWTGHISTSFKTVTRGNDTVRNNDECDDDDSSSAKEEQHGGSLYNGDTHVLYWADTTNEIAFVVPTLRNRHCKSEPAVNDLKSSTNETATANLSTSVAGGSGVNTSFRKRPNFGTTVMLVWLENYEDHAHFPSRDLLPFTSTGLEDSQARAADQQDCYVVFLHPLQNGLLRIKVQTSVKRASSTAPMIDGMVLSRRVAGPLIRQTIVDICKGRRVDNDLYQPPHVRRRLKIQEMSNRYKKKMGQPEFFSYLLSNC